MSFTKLNKKVTIGDFVSCPVGSDYNNYTDYECAKIIRFFKSTKGDDCAEVKVWYHNTGIIENKKVALKNLRKIKFYHSVNEEQMFIKALELEGIQIINDKLEYLRVNNKCTDEGYLKVVSWN